MIFRGRKILIHNTHKDTVMFRKNPVLPARILVYVLAISVVIATIIGALISLKSIRQAQYELFSQNIDLYNNTKSGVELLLDADTSALRKTSHDLYENETDTVTISKRFWGVYALGTLDVHKNTIQGKISNNKSMLLGGDLLEEQQAAIYLAGRNNELNIGGTTKIIGDAYLPIGGIKTAMINGVNYRGNRLIYDGKKKQSKRFLPPRNQLLIDTIKNYFKPIVSNSNVESLSQPNSFLQPTKIISGQDVYLNNLSLKGNIIVKADSTVVITANNQIEDIIVIATNIIVESGFRGNLQLFAKRTITIQSNVELNYPSAIVLFKEDGMQITKQPIIEIGERSLVEGVIWLEELKINRTKGIVIIKEKALIHGQVICNGFVDVKGAIYGNVSCTGFFLKTAASVYENHLFNTVIDATKLNPYFVNHIIFDKTSSNQIIKWLE